MRNVTVICYFFSLLSFGVGYSKALAYKYTIIEQVNIYDYTTNLSLATSFLVLAIFFAVIGFAFHTLRIMEHKVHNETNISDRIGNQKETISHKTQGVYSCDS